MAAYMIVDIINILDPDLYEKYVELVPSIITIHGGRYLAQTEQIISLAGGWTPRKIILLEFDTVDQLRACLQSEEYREIAPLREQSTEGRAIVVEG